MADLNFFAEDVINRLQRVRRLRGQITNEIWYDLEVRRLEEVTINFIREACGSDPRIARRLGELIGSPASDPQSSVTSAEGSGRDRHCTSDGQ